VSMTATEDRAAAGEPQREIAEELKASGDVNRPGFDGGSDYTEGLLS